MSSLFSRFEATTVTAAATAALLTTQSSSGLNSWQDGQFKFNFPIYYALVQANHVNVDNNNSKKNHNNRGDVVVKHKHHTNNKKVRKNNDDDDVDDDDDDGTENNDYNDNIHKYHNNLNDFSTIDSGLLFKY
ncbi:probable cyclin-dependent serine/threonine-protein kinase DDB_G0292550 [Glossina fuscipes]|uniref:Probable cyclin-dependent serine/threonine-protein kinase DDB_G0292550 n=1 Tax=Glossina fuscipes TaxID=7396 RepID=A0A9C6E224_9MUSC|nr:probable cyclin-dependent serine/threonine-protein kinase DDB_G0292550 [Glossina fuscipes]